MSDFTKTQLRRLKGKLDRRFVQSRSVEGRSVDYIEGWFAIAQANAKMDNKGVLTNEFVNARVGPARDAMLVPRDGVEYIDVSPKQVVAPSGSILSIRLPTVGFEARPEVVSDSPHLHDTHSSLI